jgi:hypothetical protein
MQLHPPPMMAFGVALHSLLVRRQQPLVDDDYNNNNVMLIKLPVAEFLLYCTPST